MAGLVLDLYDAFEMEKLVVGARTFRRSVTGFARTSYEALVHSIGERIRREKTTKYDRVVALSCFARVCAWRDDKSDAPRITVMYGAVTFPLANWGCSGMLRTTTTVRIGQAIRSANRGLPIDMGEH